MATAPSSLNRPLSPETSSVLAKPYNVKTKEKPVISLEPKLDHEYLTGLKLFIVVAAAAIVAFLMLLDNMIAIPRITDEFHSLADVGWYASAYQFGSSAPQPLTGRIYKYFNTKVRMKFICGAATSSNMFIVGRFIAGFGAAGIATGSITIVSLCAPLEKRPRK
ncbi:putative HC-toxin efflux carrier TOXA [Glarea lozoyensis 74030]|uniref:Putative HC-toxin efflux carrier TOXA n=1 Tax=Glarea lozoyensis (strain ATCC 74030 / MF5533) TaxID=1104152 RepID=H0EHR7_GLAL7|nr:putative HC-toxin efflux carrier TOXA [Glarea lozoyensis 74030]